MAWQTSFSEGELYYFNTTTGEVTHECPDELIDEDGAYQWASHEEDVFVPCKIIEIDGDRAYIEIQGGKTLHVNSSALTNQSIPSMQSLLTFPHDLLEMDIINEPSVLYTLRNRFMKDEVYTSVGDILVVVNPFKTLSTPPYEEYLQTSRSEIQKLRPHPFLTASNAYNLMKSTNVNQTILIGGESGSGKTETTKTCLRFLSLAAGSSQNADVEGRIMAANPILEAFGNAKTIRNDNSSRFGKFLELYYSSDGSIHSCTTTNYLLEKCRVHRQSTGERSFHIFYQLCEAAHWAETSIESGQSVLGDDEFRNSLQLQPIEYFSFLSQSGCTHIPGVIDRLEFLSTESAARTLGFRESDICELFSLCAAVLHLGNLRVSERASDDGTDGCVIDELDETSKSSLYVASSILGVSTEQLCTALCSRSLFIRGERTVSGLSAQQALEFRDVLCKYLYSDAFDWIVRSVNVTFESGGSVGQSEQNLFIGILDIFGFEIFDVNSFEQLCINYANEKLQQFFNRRVFKTEEALYINEGIPLDGFEFVDNQDVLDLIESKPSGILSIIDDEVSIPRANDVTLLRKLYQAHGESGAERSTASARFLSSASASANDSFVISHYAGSVEYRIDGFLDTSRDKLNDDLREFLEKCTSKLTLLNDAFLKNSSSNITRASSKVQTLGKKFRIQLEQLLGTLSSTTTHYIKCIKPNCLKAPNCFQGTTSFSQLKASGVFEAVAIRKRGLTFRMSHEMFIREYGPLRRDFICDSRRNKKARCEALVGYLQSLPNGEFAKGFFIGKTLVFWRYDQQKRISDLMYRLNLLCSVRLQSVIRGFCCRQTYARMLSAVSCARNVLVLPDVESSLNSIDHAIDLLSKFKYRHYQLLLVKKERILEVRRLTVALEEMQHIPLRDIDEKWIDSAKAAMKIGVTGPAAEKVFAMYKLGSEKVECMQRLKSVISSPTYDTEEIESVLRDLGKLKQSLGYDFCVEEEGICRDIMISLQGTNGTYTPVYDGGRIATAEVEGRNVSVRDTPAVASLRDSCIVCNEVFEYPPRARTPRMLSCLHCCCARCLNDIRDRLKAGITCPVPGCQAFTKCASVTALKVNTRVLSLLPPLCDNCEEEAATLKCLHCATDCARLCPSCSDKHQKIKAFRNHRMVKLQNLKLSSLDTDASNCVRHPSKKLNAYCTNCETVVCLSCAVFDHPDHTVLPSSTAGGKERDIIASMWTDLKSDISALKNIHMELSSTQPALQDQRRIMREMTSVVFNSIESLVRSRHADLLSSLEVLYSKKRRALVDQIEALTFELECHNSAISTCSQICETGSATEVLQMVPNMRSHLTDLLGTPLSTSNVVDSDLAFSPGPKEEVQNLISSVGLCRGTPQCPDPMKCSLEVVQCGLFCSSWRCLLLLTLRNNQGEKLGKGGQPVAFEAYSNLPPSVPVDEVPNVPNDSDSSVRPTTVRKYVLPNSDTGAASQTSESTTVPLVSRRTTTRSNDPVSHRNSKSPFTTSVTDNHDGTYFLLLSYCPSEGRVPDMCSQPEPEAYVTVKLFGQSVRGSPLTLNPYASGDIDVATFDGHLPSSVGTNDNRGVSRSVSDDNISQMTFETSNSGRTVESFFKYITGGLI